MLVFSHNRTTAQQKMQQTVSFLGGLGFTLNQDKSDLTARQSFTYLGLQWDTRSLSVCLPANEALEPRATAASLQTAPHAVPARVLMTVAYAVSLARLHCQDLQFAGR